MVSLMQIICSQTQNEEEAKFLFVKNTKNFFSQGKGSWINQMFPDKRRSGSADTSINHFFKYKKLEQVADRSMQHKPFQPAKKPMTRWVI